MVEVRCDDPRTLDPDTEHEQVQENDGIATAGNGYQQWGVWSNDAEARQRSGEPYVEERRVGIGQE